MIVLLGDFIADLLKCHDDKVANFFDAMHSKLLLPNICSQTWIRSISATLINNIFTSGYNNLFLALILIVPIWNTTRHKEPRKVYRDFQEFLRNKDIPRDLQNFIWDTELQLNSGSINISTEKLISKINNLMIGSR